VSTIQQAEEDGAADDGGTASCDAVGIREAQRQAQAAEEWGLVGRLLLGRWMSELVDETEPWPEDPLAGIPVEAVLATPQLALVAVTEACRWGKRAEALNKILSKGSQLCVEGRIQTRQWEDKDGNKRYTTEVRGDRIVLLSGGGGGGGARQQTRSAGPMDEVIPEPGTYALIFGLGIGALVLTRRRFRK
jgi:hypothetical protein